MSESKDQVNTEAPLVYLDWAATAPLSPCAYDAMAPYLAPGAIGIEQGGGNANSLHSPGRRAFKVLETARRAIARSLGARPDEIIFTSGASEADNLALVGIAEGLLQKRGQSFGLGQKMPAARPSVIVSAIEHDAILQAADHLRKRGIKVVFVQPNRAGFITPEALQAALDVAEDPLLVSIMALNNEIGSVMDIAALSKVAHAAGALFHTDATQALGKINIPLKEWDVDALSLSSHKVGGPKGVGALYLKARTPFVPQIVGGGQEAGKRSGTQNIAGVAGFAAALVDVVENQDVNARAMTHLRDLLYQGAVALEGVEAVVELSTENYGPHIVSLMCPGFESETLILQLDKRGICASGGSACSSQSLEPSHVLTALGIDRDCALGMLRLSLGPTTTEDDIERCIEGLQEVLRTTWN